MEVVKCFDILKVHMFHFVTIQFILFLSPSAEAFNCMHRGLEQHIQELTKIGYVEEPGEIGRRTEDEYASDKKRPVEEIKQQFAATGVLDCKTSQCSAQLTGDNRTITTVGHIFTDLKTCKAKNRPGECKFVYQQNGVEKSIPVAGLFETGIRCPVKPGSRDDWTVLKLAKPAVGVKPYRVPGEFEFVMKDAKVISVHGKDEDFLPNGTYQKSIEDCRVKSVFQIYDTPETFESTCDGSLGSSGGSILQVIEGEAVLLGIVHDNYENEKQRQKVLKEHVGESHPYVTGKWSGKHVAVAGEFLKAIRSATEGR